jgi:LEA14-like dessication related protein
MRPVVRRRSTPRCAAARAACAVAVALAASGCASLAAREPIEVNVVRLTPLASTAFEHRLRVDLRLRNPNNRSYEIDGLRFVLDVNGRRLASGLSHEPVTLPRLGEVVVPVTTTTTLLDLVNQIVAFGREPQQHFEYRVRGKLFLKGPWGALTYDRSGTDADLLPRRASSSPTPSGRGAP